MDNNDLSLINNFARAKLSEKEVYTFDFILCDNEIDRDMERFSDEALEDIAKLFVGVTGIFDHDVKSANQSARIYMAKCITDEENKNSLGTPYKFVKAKAYMIRTENNKDLIAEIEGGIKKEVSIGCRVDKKICSICKKEIKKGCGHKKGMVYKNKFCHHILDKVGDGYEWSFVAVPAQRKAGVTKKFSTLDEKGVKNFFGAEQIDSDAVNFALIGKKQMDMVKRETYKEIFPLCSQQKAKLLGEAMDKLSYVELKALKSVLECTKGKDSPLSQFCRKEKNETEENSSFKI